MKISPAATRAAQENTAKIPAAHDAQAQKKQAVIQGLSPSENEPVSLENMEKTLRQINQTTEAFNVGLRFKVHEESDRMMVQIIDTEKNEVLKEIPPEKVLNLAAQIQNMIGVLLDTKR